MTSVENAWSCCADKDCDYKQLQKFMGNYQYMATDLFQLVFLSDI